MKTDAYIWMQLTYLAIKLFQWNVWSFHLRAAFFNNEFGILRINTHSMEFMSGDRATVRVNTCGTDRLYKKIVEDRNLTVAENVVYVPTGAAQYNLFNANGGTRGEKGAVYDLLEWQQRVRCGQS